MRVHHAYKDIVFLKTDTDELFLISNGTTFHSVGAATEHHIFSSYNTGFKEDSWMMSVFDLMECRMYQIIECLVSYKKDLENNTLIHRKPMTYLSIA